MIGTQRIVIAILKTVIEFRLYHDERILLWLKHNNNVSIVVQFRENVKQRRKRNAQKEIRIL